MKRGVLCAVFCLIIALGLAACGGSSGSSSPGSSGSADTTAPHVPTDLLATAASSSSIALNWTASSDDVGVTGYKIFRNGSLVSTSTTNAFSDTGLTSSTTYTYTISAYDANGNNSAQSSSAAATTLASGTSDTIAPSIPANLIATVVSTTQINLTWGTSTDDTGVAGYEVWRGTSKIATSTITSYNDSGLTAGTSYTYFVKAFDGTGNISSASNSAAATTSTTQTADTTSPSTPTGLTATAVSANSIVLNWNASTDNVAVQGYKIYRNDAQISTSPSISYVDSGLNSNTTYTYTVSAYDGAANNSSQSLSANAKTTTTGAIKLPKTGVTSCVTSTRMSISCANTGQDGDLQKGVAWPDPRFTDNGNDTVTDNLTGLIWPKDAKTPGPTACNAGNYKWWQDALDYISCLNTNSYLGFTDWRLPNINELKSFMMNNGTQVFTNVSSNYYWSSTSYVPSTSGAWEVRTYAEGDDGYGKATNGSGYPEELVWPVRTGQNSSIAPIQLPETGQVTCYDSSGNVIACANTGQDGDLQKGIAWPNPRFADNGDTTVTDNLTGLIWTTDGNAPGPSACSPGATKTWQGALDYAKCLNSNNYLGFTDWRVPNIIELKSLVNYGQSNAATWLNTQGITNAQAGKYWSSNAFRIVNMSAGYASTGSSSSSYYVWPVRAGQ